jgi:Bacterial Ig domain
VTPLLSVPVYRRVVTLISVVTVAMVLPIGTAHAGSGWNAQFVAQSDSAFTLESGETRAIWFEFRNVDANGLPWQRHDDGTADPRMGTTGPNVNRDRVSQFLHSSWLAFNRPARMDQATVPLNEVGRFTFIVQAPPVSAEVPYPEYFAPLIESIDWMDDAPNTATGLTITVRPRVPPQVAIAAAPDHVAQGAPVTVSATAADNVRVNRVEFSLSGQPAVVVAAAPYDAVLPTAALAAGDHTLTVTAVDGAGQATTVTRTITVDAIPNGAGAARDAKLSAGFGSKLTARHTVDYGRADRIRGRLTTAAGAPIAGAKLQISTRVVLPRTGFRLVTTAVTAADGTYSYLAPRGPSRQIRVDYSAFAGDTEPTVTRLVRMSTEAGVRLTARKRGDLVRFSGRLRGGPKPASGVLVVLQGLQSGYGWRTFRTARVSTGGRFSTSYRFRTASRGTFRFRAIMRKQIGYAYATGRSREVRIRR